MEKKLTKKTLTKSFHNWYYGNLTCFSQEHMQTFGYLCSMLPIVNELYNQKQDKAKAMQKDGEMTEDELKNAENEIQKITDKNVEEVDKIIEAKEIEIMSI